jgi:hypothetical protein
MAPAPHASAIEQINLAYDPIQDRIVLRLRSRDGGVAALWLHRRLTRLLLPALVKLVGDGLPAAGESIRRELLAYEHQSTVDAGEFANAFKGDGAETFPEGPLLVAYAIFTSARSRMRSGYNRRQF